MLTSDDEMRIGNSEICTMLLISLLQLKGMKSESVSHSVMCDSATPLTVACQAPLCMGFSRREYRSGLPFLSPGHLPAPRIESRSFALLADSLPSKPTGKPMKGNKGSGKGFSFFSKRGFTELESN